MANRPVLRRRGVAAPAPEPVKAKKASKPVVEEEEIDEVEEPEEDEDAEDVEEDEDEEPAPVIRKKAVAPAPAPVVKKAVAAPPPAPVTKKVPAKTMVEDDETEEATEPVKKSVKVKPVEATVAGSLVLELLQGMSEGQSVMITRTADNKWTFGTADAKPVSKGLIGRAYWDEVIDPAYWAWEQEWSQLTQDERIKKAKKAGVTWNEDKDPRVNIMRASAAYREQIGIEKYKEQYRSRGARAAIRG